MRTASNNPDTLSVRKRPNGYTAKPKTESGKQEMKFSYFKPSKIQRPNGYAYLDWHSDEGNANTDETDMPKPHEKNAR